MADIDLETVTPSASDATDYKVVRRGAGPFSVALVADVPPSPTGPTIGLAFAIRINAILF